MIIQRLLPQVRTLARRGFGYEDVMVKLRIHPRNMHVMRREMIEAARSP